jgi:hypothetical protein
MINHDKPMDFLGALLPYGALFSNTFTFRVQQLSTFGDL